MNIAAITITYNDDYKFNEWVEHYQFYRDELYLHIIVDNSSNSTYLTQVENTFFESVIIKRNSNGGCTIAYNDGIRYALKNKNVDAIMLIGNDIKLEKGGITKLYNFLNSNKNYGMVAPAMFIKDTQLIEDFGSEITSFMIMKPRFFKKTISELPYQLEEVPAVMGGMNLAKREFYEKVGLQDENLFMYSDEVDMGLRARKAGYLMAVTANVHSWHQHINPMRRQTRLPFSSYLIGRNKVYLARKHKGVAWALVQFVYHFYLFLIGWVPNIMNKEKRLDRIYFLRGSYYGLINNMNIKNIVKDTE